MNDINKRQILTGKISQKQSITGHIDSATTLSGYIQPIGRDGVGLEFEWDGTKLGVKREDENEYTFVDLRGKSTIDDLTDKHIYKALGYVPASVNSLEREVYHLQVRDKQHDSEIKTLFEKTTGLNLIVEGYDLTIDELKKSIQDLYSIKADLSDIPTKLSDLEIDVEIGKDFTEEINSLNQAVTKLQSVKADMVYVDSKIKQLSNDLSEKININTTNINYIKEELGKHIDLANSKYKEIILMISQKASVEQVEDLQKQIDNIDIPDGVDLTPIYDELNKLKTNKANITDIPTKLSEMSNDTNYITIADVPVTDLTDVYTKLNNLSSNLDDLNTDMELKADKSDVPSKTSQLHNDSGYITIDDVPKCDLTEIESSLEALESLMIKKADKVYVDEQITFVKEQIDNLEIPDEVDLSPIYNKLNELALTKSDEVYVKSEIARLEKLIGEILGGDEIDLSEYAKKVDLPTHLSELENDTKYITIDDIVEYDDSEVKQHIAEINGKLANHNLTLSEINGEIIIIQSSLDKKADKSYVDTKLQGYYQKSETYTRDEVDDRIGQIIGNAPEDLDTLEKLANALDNDESFASSITKGLSNKVDKVSGKGLSSNDYTNTEKLKLSGVEYGANRVTKVSELSNDIGYITLSDIKDLQPQIDALGDVVQRNKLELDSKINKINDVDATQNIEINKRALQSDLDELTDVVNAIEIPDEVDLEPIIADLDRLELVKADKSKLDDEVSRLEKTIKDIVTGETEDRVRIIPYITETPIMNELYYKQLKKEPPKSHWTPDAWGVWTVVNQNHLQCKSSNTYDALSTNITGGKGVINIKIVKEDKDDRHMLSLIRDGKQIINIRETRGDKEYSIEVKPGDRLTITSLFAGDVYLDYSGEEGDYRLYAYKNGVEERIANAYLVEKRLEDYITRAEGDSVIELLDVKKADVIDIPTKVSQLKNDSNYSTLVDLDKKSDKIIQDKTSGKKYEFEIVGGRPGIKRVQ